MKILVLEDDKFICEQIKTYFELNDHIVDIFYDGEALLDNARVDLYDIFLFDINTPKKNGLETLKVIRDDNITTPAIFLTALSDIEFVKQGYKVGCNDYVRKPFNLEEVELRIFQLIQNNNKSLVKIDNFYSFDLKKLDLYFKDQIVELNKQEKFLLEILVKNIGNIVEPNIIKDYIWKEQSVCDNTLRTKIKKLRSKLQNNFIKNIRNSGYKIVYDPNR